MSYYGDVKSVGLFTEYITAHKHHARKKREKTKNRVRQQKITKISPYVGSILHDKDHIIVIEDYFKYKRFEHEYNKDNKDIQDSPTQNLNGSNINMPSPKPNSKSPQKSKYKTPISNPMFSPQFEESFNDNFLLINKKNSKSKSKSRSNHHHRSKHKSKSRSKSRSPKSRSIYTHEPFTVIYPSHHSQSQIQTALELMQDSKKPYLSEGEIII